MPRSETEDVAGGSQGILVTHIEETRVRHEGRWFAADVIELGPRSLRVNIPRTMELDGEMHLACRIKGSISGTVHLKAERLQVRRDARGSQVTLRPHQAFATEGRPLLIEFVTRLLGEQFVTEESIIETTRGTYYNFGASVKHETAPITRRSLEHAIRSPSQFVSQALARHDSPPDQSEVASQPAPRTRGRSPSGSGRVAAGTAIHQGLAAAVPKVTQMPALDVDIAVSVRAYGKNLTGTVYRVTTDGHRVFMQMPHDAPALWDTVWLYLSVPSPTGDRSLHVRGTVVRHMNGDAPNAGDFVVRLFEVGREEDLVAWRRAVAKAVRDHAANSSGRQHADVRLSKVG